MCYCNCQFEYYPEGPNEECRCRRGQRPCPYDEEAGEVDRDGGLDRYLDWEPEPERDWERDCNRDEF